MARLEYPKHVYKGEGDERTSLVVQHADEEAAAADKGYAALPPAPELREAEAAAIDAQGAYLEFPKHVYKGEGDARESRVVKDADAEAAAADEGYAPIGAPVAAKPKKDAKSKKA